MLEILYLALLEALRRLFHDLPAEAGQAAPLTPGRGVGSPRDANPLMPKADRGPGPGEGEPNPAPT
jgi:hypothetical protein